ncbi:MAG TPA: RDD family protein [Opitutaceae bacterium]
MTPSRTQVVRVHTPEGVAFSYRIASPVLRAGALVIDKAVIAAGYTLLAAAVKVLGLISVDLTMLVLTFLFFLLSEGYHIGCEWLWGGQSVGKRLLRLRVVDGGGLRLTFTQVAMRNLLRFIDALPALYLVGGGAAFLSAKGQRLGDLVAGTLVIWHPAEALPEIENLRGEKYNSLRAHGPVMARLRQAVSPAEARLAWLAIARRNRLEAGVRIRLFGDFAAHFRQVARAPDGLLDGVADEQFVRNVVDVLYHTR